MNVGELDGPGIFKTGSAQTYSYRLKRLQFFPFSVHERNINGFDPAQLAQGVFQRVAHIFAVYHG